MRTFLKPVSGFCSLCELIVKYPLILNFQIWNLPKKLELLEFQTRVKFVWHTLNQYLKFLIMDLQLYKLLCRRQ
jgi:hypothetical protein